MKNGIKKWFDNLLNEPKNQKKSEQTDEKNVRKLIKNSKTGIFEWSEGESPLPTTVEELTFKSPGPEISESYVYKTEMAELAMANLFEVSMKDMDSKLVKGFWTYGEETKTKTKKRIKSAVELLIPIAQLVSILSLKKGDNLDTISVTFLDRVGFKAATMYLENCKIEEIYCPMNLSYGKDEFLKTTLLFLHDPFRIEEHKIE